MKPNRELQKERVVMRVLGVTGGVGSGKSKVLGYLEEEYGAVICQLDHVARELQKQGQDCYLNIVKQFGEEIIGADKELDRKKLSGLIFQDEEKRKLLNAIIHPEVKAFVERDMEKKRAEKVSLYIIEAAILPGAGYEDICGEMWYIYAPESVRRERLKQSRGYTDERITSMMEAQPTEQAFRRECQAVIDNSGFFENTKKQIGEIL